MRRHRRRGVSIVRDEAPRDDRLELSWREADVLPAFELRLHRPRPIVALKAGKPRDTGELTPYAVEVTSGPARMSPTTGDPARLRTMARALLEAADELEARTATAPRLPLELER